MLVYFEGFEFMLLLLILISEIENPGNYSLFDQANIRFPQANILHMFIAST